MLTSSTVSVPLIPHGESSQRAVVFTVELPRGQVLSPTFTNPDIIAVLVNEHMTIGPMAVQKCDEKNTLLQKVKKLKKSVVHCHPLRCG